jgi:hypothetical protein
MDNKTIVDIATGKKPHLHLDKAIEKHINFRDHLEGSPIFATLEHGAQSDMLSAYLRDSGHKEAAEVWEELAESMVFGRSEMIADIIQSRSNWDICLTNSPWLDLVAELRCAAQRRFSEAIDKRMEELYSWFCRDYGVYSIDSTNGPGELVGFEGDA